VSPASAIVDERWAVWAAAAVAPRASVDPHDAASLREAIEADLPAVDAAARAFTGLGGDLPPVRVSVIGRLGWVRTNLAALRGVLDPLGERLARRPGSRQLISVQLGAVLGLLSSKVLGQFVMPLDGRSVRDGEPGQLVVVGPNVLHVAVDHPDLAVDIRRAVLLHEVTHRLQFAVAEWLAGHLHQLVATYLSHARIDPEALQHLAADAPRILADVRRTGTIKPIVDAVLTSEQAEVLERAQALMTLLEGHGNVVMLDGGTGLVDDPEAIRATLGRRHQDVTSRLLTSLFGMDAKRRQYREGEVFVREVVAQGGMATLNRAFTSPEHLPCRDELDDPSAWMRRIAP
jgi:coenzyme F420 biosynthesis associated uncharacterized protein